MGTNNRKQSGLDIEALNAKMNALDQKAEKEKEVQQESVDLKELVEELRLTIGDVRFLVPKVRELMRLPKSTRRIVLWASRLLPLR